MRQIIDKTIENVGFGNAPRNVLRGAKCQNVNLVGVHWLRVSIPRQYILECRDYVSRFFGDTTADGYGLWSYDSRYLWTSGVSLNFDAEIDRSDAIHKGMATLDCNGSALDDLASDDLQLFIIGLAHFSPSCTRIDVFFDDYDRTITPHEILTHAEKGDYSGFKRYMFKKSGDRQDNGSILRGEEIAFGKRGADGSGKYLRVYDKNLESDGEFNCIRWETEFTGDRAKQVFDTLAKTTSLTAFATICGMLVGGCICFIKRTGDRHLERLKKHEFWDLILQQIGDFGIRERRKEKSYDTTMKWVHVQVTPTLACLRDTFIDESDFFNWLLDQLRDGEDRMNARLRFMAKKYKRSLRYSYTDIE